MESARRSSLRRKPLSDCTNTIAVVRTKSKQRPKTSSKSITSTGSNNPPNVHTNLLSESDPPAPPTPISDTGSRDRRKIEPSTAQSQKDEKIRKDKEKMSSTTPVVQASKPLIRQALLRSSFTTTGSLVVQNNKNDAEERKDKSKMVLETPNTETTELVRPHVPLSTSSGNYYLSGPPESQNLKLCEQKRADKGKMILESPITEITDIPRPHVSMASSSAAGTWYRPPSQKNKDKEKIILETNDIFRPHMSLSSSSATYGNCHLLWSPGILNQKLDAQERKDKGKNILDSLINDTSNSSRFHDPMTSYSSASDDCHAYEFPAIEIQKFNAPKNKDKRKMVHKTVDIEANPSTPMGSSSAASGTCDQERPVSLTVYNQRRALRRRKSADEITIALTSSPNKRPKNKGFEVDDNCGKKNSGSHTDPLFLRKKKQAQKKTAHSLLEEEIERLKKLYEKDDEFEIPVEDASESD